MIEDKLTPDQRLRLECLNQAVQTSPGLVTETIVKKAGTFEDYVRNGVKEGSDGSQGTTRS